PRGRRERLLLRILLGCCGQATGPQRIALTKPWREHVTDCGCGSASPCLTPRKLASQSNRIAKKMPLMWVWPQLCHSEEYYKETARDFFHFSSIKSGSNSRLGMQLSPARTSQPRASV